MGARQLNDEWTAYVVGRLHRFRISRKELADKCGYTLTYLSMVLNNYKEFSCERSKERTKNHILKSLREIETQILKDIRDEKSKEEKWYDYFNKT